MPSEPIWFDHADKSEADIARMILEHNQAEHHRLEDRVRASGFTEPRAARGSRWPEVYHDAEHARRLDRILGDIKAM